MEDKAHNYQRRTSALMVLSTLTTAVTLFAVFRYTAKIVSVEWIGVWSLIQGLFLVARISDSGAGANISRVLAVRVKNHDAANLKNLTAAAIIVASAPSAVLSLLTALPIGWYVIHQFGGELDIDALKSLIALAVLNAVLAAVANILLAICEGMFRLNFKSITVIGANLAGLLALKPLLQHLGPAGVGWTYIVIAAAQCLLAGAQVCNLSRSSASAKISTVQHEIAVIWRENLHLSGIALVRLSFEPATKFTLSLIAPLSVIAEFELALRVTTQIRVIVQSALQPLLVLGARSTSEHSERAISTFMRNDKTLSLLTVGALLAQILAAPAVQLLGLGTIDSRFVVFFAILAVGNAVNTIGLAGYYWQLSSGTLTPLIKVQAVMALVNVGVGVLAWAVHSAVLAVCAYSCSFALGGLASRSFLPGIRWIHQITSVLLVAASGLTGTLVVMTMGPSTRLDATTLVIAAAASALISLFISYRSLRRQP